MWASTPRTQRHDPAMANRTLRWAVIIFAPVLLVLAGAAALRYVPWFHPLKLRITGGGVTVEQRLAQDGPAAIARWTPRFQQANSAWPPAAVTLIVCKAERFLEVHATGSDGIPHLIQRFPILAASGKAGPKTREGDLQVPEGVYAVESLNPNSAYHRALRVGYPSADDRRIAAAEGRTELGGDIMIHGSNVSIGCIAVGDAAAEDLFILAATVGIGRVTVLIAPCDLRVLPAPDDSRAWVQERYRVLATRMRDRR